MNATRQSRIQLELVQTRTGLQAKLERETRSVMGSCLYFHFEYLRFLWHAILLQEHISSTFLDILQYLDPPRMRKQDTEFIAIQHH